MGSSPRPETSPARPEPAFLECLEAETERWVAERVIRPRQAALILAFYGLRRDVGERAGRLGRTASIFATLGAILIGIGVILLVASNRQAGDMPRLVKVGGLLAAVLSVNGLGYLLAYETRFSTIGRAVVFLGGLMFGAAVFLAGQVYNFSANDPSLLLYWFLGVVPLSYVTRSNACASLSLVALGAWLGSWAISAMEDTHSGDLTFVRMVALLLMLGVLVYFLAPLHRAFEPTRGLWRPFQMIGLVVIFASLFVLSNQFWFDDLQYRRPALPDSVVLSYAVLLGLGLTAAAASVWVRRPRTLTTLFEAGAGVVVLLAAAIVASLRFEDARAYGLLFNGLALAGVVGAIPLGLARSQQVYVNAAVGLFALVVIARYFDLAWGLQERAFVFMGGGVLVLVGATVLEQYRRRLLRSFRDG